MDTGLLQLISLFILIFFFFCIIALCLLIKCHLDVARMVLAKKNRLDPPGEKPYYE